MSSIINIHVQKNIQFIIKTKLPCLMDDFPTIFGMYSLGSVVDVIRGRVGV